MHYSNVTVILSQIELVPSVLWIVTILYYVFRDWEEKSFNKIRLYLNNVALNLN